MSDIVSWIREAGSVVTSLYRKGKLTGWIFDIARLSIIMVKRQAVRFMWIMLALTARIVYPRHHVSGDKDGDYVLIIYQPNEKRRSREQQPRPAQSEMSGPSSAAIGSPTIAAQAGHRL